MLNKKILISILKSVGVILLYVIVYLWIELFEIVDFDGSCHLKIHMIGMCVATCILIFKCWSKKYSKGLWIIFTTIVIMLSVNIVYFDKISMIIEPLIYFHNKYDISYSEITIKETTSHDEGYMWSVPRSATIMYEDKEIIVKYISGKWEDNYDDILCYEKCDSEILEQIDVILRNRVSKYKVVYDPAKKEDSFGYDIVLCTSESETVESIIDKMDKLISDYWLGNGMGCAKGKDKYICYSIYMTKDDETYEMICEYDFSKIEFDYHGHAYGGEVLSTIMGKEVERIFRNNEGYDKEKFVSNGGSDDGQYEHLVFWYDSEPNAIPGSQMFHIFAIP